MCLNIVGAILHVYARGTQHLVCVHLTVMSMKFYFFVTDEMNSISAQQSFSILHILVIKVLKLSQYI